MATFPISEKLKERFCTDYKIPINIYTEPYFTERLHLFDFLFQAKEKWNRFVDEVYKYDSEQAYFEDYNRVKDEAINFIKETEEYQRFNSEDMSKYSVLHQGLPGKDIYKPINDGRLFISIDMKKANFSSLKQYDAGIFEGACTWEDFIRKFTDNEHIVNSKYIRQVILGNCNPKRHITYEKYLMDKIITAIEHDTYLLEKGLTLSDIVFFSNDEIVFDVTRFTINLGKFQMRLIHLLNEENMGVPLRVEIFRLKKINGISDGYIKENCTEMPEIKGVDANMYPFVVRALKNEDIKENDKVFVFNGRLAKYMEIPFIAL